jgi:hypothetical protein
MSGGGITEAKEKFRIREMCRATHLSATAACVHSAGRYTPASSVNYSTIVVRLFPFSTGYINLGYFRDLIQAINKVRKIAKIKQES